MRQLIAILCLFICVNVHSASFTVSNSNDSGIGSLRQAILDANSILGLDTIDVNPSVSTITLSSLNFTLPIPVSLPDLSEVVINGNGVSLFTSIDSRCFNVGSGTIINQVSFWDFKYHAVYVAAITQPVVLNHCNFINGSNLIDINTPSGGALFKASGILHLNGCQFSNNVANKGGAIGTFYTSGVIFMDQCTFVDNVALSGEGNAVFIDDGCNITLTGLTTLGFLPPIQNFRLNPPIGDPLGNSVILGPSFQLNPGDILDIY